MEQLKESWCSGVCKTDELKTNRLKKAAKEGNCWQENQHEGSYRSSCWQTWQKKTNKIGKRPTEGAAVGTNKKAAVGNQVRRKAAHCWQKKRPTVEAKELLSTAMELLSTKELLSTAMGLRRDECCQQ